MPDLVLTTFDWVPEMPRGYVRDLRVRWALEEAGWCCQVSQVEAIFSSFPGKARSRNGRKINGPAERVALRKGLGR